MFEDQVEMPLGHALMILCEVHTRADSRTGFRVEIGATPRNFGNVSEANYIEAWRVVRRAAGLQTETPDSPNPSEEER